MFLKKNKIIHENVRYAATKSLPDESGAPLLWELRRVGTKETDQIQDRCIVESKKGAARTRRLDTTRYMRHLVAASVVFPDLYNAQLQDSYGVSTPEELVQEMVDNPGEWNELVLYVCDLCGVAPMDEDIDTVKN